jgi:hypothetical protein
MGSTNSIPIKEHQLDRTLDEENRIYVGIVQPVGSIPYSNQALQLGRGYLSHKYRLQNFIENNNSLVYEFEYDYKLTLTKRNSDIIICIRQDDKYKLITMDILTRKNFKPFGKDDTTFEFNKLYEFIAIREHDPVVEKTKKL